MSVLILMTPLPTHILGLAVLCALALQTALNGDFSTATSAVAAMAREGGCEPAADRLSAKATLSDRAGRYRLTLVANSGAADSGSTSGDSGSAAHLVVSGLLTLRQQAQQGQQTRTPEPPDDPSTPLYGFTDIDPRSVGAHRVGDPGSKDPSAPGVLVLEREEYGRRVITLRLGSQANRRDLVRYDGAYTVLRVKEIDKGGFAGSWRSGGGLDLSVTTGYFCAREVP